MPSRGFWIPVKQVKKGDRILIEENLYFDIIWPIEQQIKDLHQDFIPYDKGDIFFFTEKMADSFIEEAVEICQKEIESIFNGGQFMDQEIGAWNI